MGLSYVGTTGKKVFHANWKSSQSSLPSRQPLTAEGHDVLYFAQRPVKQIVFGVKGSVWIIFEHADDLGDHCRRVLSCLSLNGPRLSY